MNMLHSLMLMVGMYPLTLGAILALDRAAGWPLFRAMGGEVDD